jgi:monofunctional glycosyltransferase
LPGPRLAYNPYKNLGRVLKRSNMILRLLVAKGVLTTAEYQMALAETPNVGRMQKKVDESIKKVEVMANLSSARAAEPPDSEDKGGNKEPQAAPAPAPEPAPAPAPAPGSAAPEVPAQVDKQ